MQRIPNLTHPAAPRGGEEDAVEVGRGKTPIRTFDFQPKDHLALGELHDLFDFEAGARVAGAGFYFLKNAAVKLDLPCNTLQSIFFQIAASHPSQHLTSR